MKFSISDDGKFLLVYVPLHQIAGQIVPALTEQLARFVSITNARDEKQTAREHEVLQLVVDGMKNRDIAKALDISMGTVKFHIGHLLKKFNAKSRYELRRVAGVTRRVTGMY